MDMLPQIGAVLAVFALLGLTLMWLRKRGAVQFSPRIPFRLPGGGTSKSRLLEQVDRLQLSPTHSLNAVRMGDRVILIGTSPSGFYLVESSPWKSVQPHLETQN